MEECYSGIIDRAYVDIESMIIKHVHQQIDLLSASREGKRVVSNAADDFGRIRSNLEK